MFLLNTAADGALLIKSGMLFHKRPRLESLFCARERYSLQWGSARLEKLPQPSTLHMKWDIFKYILQILHTSLAAARMAVLLRTEDLQRALHTFQSGKRLPRNFMESMPNVLLFAAGICSRSLVLRSYLTSFLIKFSCIKGGLVLLSVLYISIISIRRFWVWIFVLPVFASNALNVDL